MKRTVLWQSLGVVTILTMIQAPLLQTLHPLTTSVSVGDNWSQSPHKHKHWAACLKVPDDFPVFPGQTPAFHQSQERPTLAFIYSTDQPPTLKSLPKMYCFVQYVPISLLNLSLPALPNITVTTLGEGRVKITATVDAENTARGLRMESVS